LGLLGERENNKLTKKYGLISIITGAISIFMFTFLAGIASMVTAFLEFRTNSGDDESEDSSKNLYFCIIGLALTIVAFWLHSYVF